MSRPTVAKIHLSALKHNIQRIKQFAPNSKILAIVKANGYGHNATLISEALDHTAALGVACFEEAYKLRLAGVTRPIVLLEGFFSPEEAQRARQLCLDIVVHHHEHINTLIAQRKPWPTRIWLKMNSGMNRLGFSPEDFKRAYADLTHAGIFSCKPILMTHFACSEALRNPFTQIQYDRFNATTVGLEGERCLANSAAIIAHPHTHHDWVRPGIMLYGASPLPDQSAAQLNLEPVMTLESSLISIQNCEAGDVIGYGSLFQCPEKMRVGVVAIGYADGYPREIAQDTCVVINGRRANIIGRVSMDMLNVDLRALPQAKLGDKVELWGPQLPIEEIARAANTIPYTLLVGINQRVKYEILS